MNELFQLEGLKNVECNKESPEEKEEEQPSTVNGNGMDKDNQEQDQLKGWDFFNNITLNQDSQYYLFIIDSSLLSTPLG